MADALRVVECESIGDARAPIVPDDIEAIETKRSHHLDQVERHRALGIGQVLGVGGRLAAGAITAQVGRDDREALGEARRDLVPHHMSLRIAVNEEQRRAVAALHESDLRPRGLDTLVGETVEHGNTSGAWPRGRGSLSRVVLPSEAYKTKMITR